MAKRCVAMTLKGEQCRNGSTIDSDYCYRHVVPVDNDVVDLPDVPDIPIVANKNNNHANLRNNKRKKTPAKSKSTKSAKSAKSVKSAKSIKSVTSSTTATTTSTTTTINATKNPEVEVSVYEMTECQCCLCETDKQDIILCTKASDKFRHVCCKDCVKAYFENVLNEKKPIKCMMCTDDENCGGNYKEADIISSLRDDKLIERYHEYLAVEQVTKLSNCLSNYHICPFCSEYGIIIDNDPRYEEYNIKNVDCAKCGAIWCLNCRKGYHGHDPCNKVDSTDANIIRKVVDETIDEATIHKCPQCFTKYNKEDGCNLMTCPSCKAHSCYLCNMLIKEINGSKYWHFGSKSGSGCTIYNTDASPTSDKAVKMANVNYNNTKVISALKKLIMTNYDNNDVVKAIIKELSTRGYNVRQFKI